jgi:beta-lactamase superfamily II metal-dependent hydrolase
LLTFFAVALLFTAPQPLLSQDNVMIVHYIDVGQANATLLEFSCGAILIDAGAQDDDHIDNLTSYLRTGFARDQTYRILRFGHHNS